MLSLAEIVHQVYLELAVNDDNETYKKETVVIPRINSVMQKVLADRKYNVILPDSTYSPDIKGWDLEFLRGNMFFDRVRNVVSIWKADAGTYRIEYQPKPGNNIPTSGYIYVNGMILEYTLLEEDWHHYFVTPEAIEMSVFPGTKIEFLYPIKEEAEETYQLFAMAKGREIEVVYSDYRYPGDYLNFRSIFYKDWTKLIRLNLPETREHMQFKLNYYKKVTDLVNDTDKSLFPESRWDINVLSLLVAWELLYETEKTDDGAKKLIKGYGELIAFYDKFATINKGYRQNMWWNRKMNRPTAIIN